MHERTNLAIIIPSFNDRRVIKAIRSARLFDDCDVVSVVVADGGSSAELIAEISAELGPRDVLVSEPDDGIFDGFNRGLALASDSDFIGWIGSDDYFTGRLKSSSVLEKLRESDLFIADVLHVSDGVVQRRTPAMPSALGLWRIGLHNPHMGTFGKSGLAESPHVRVMQSDPPQTKCAGHRRSPTLNNAIRNMKDVGDEQVRLA